MKSKIKLYVDNLIYKGWKSAQIKRSLENMAGAFTLEITDYLKVDELYIKSGQSCYVEIDDKRVITGYIDEINIEIDGKNSAITISGRDKTADLIDCAAVHATGQWQNATLLKIASDLCKPFNIDVIWNVNDAEAQQAFALWQIEPSETVFDNLSKGARQRGVLMTSDEYGNLLFCSASTEHLPTVTLGKQLLSLSVNESYQKRFSSYKVIGDAFGYLWGDEQTGTQSSAVIAEIVDKEITRYRPTIILSDDNLIQTTAKIRADFEKRKNNAYSNQITITVQGWFYAENNLWQTNKLILLTALHYKNKELLIIDATFDLSNENGMTTTLLLMERNGFLAPKEIESKSQNGRQRLWKDVDNQ